MRAPIDAIKPVAAQVERAGYVVVQTFLKTPAALRWPPNAAICTRIDSSHPRQAGSAARMVISAATTRSGSNHPH